jgi:uncharacterized protein (DUF427 family)
MSNERTAMATRAVLDGVVLAEADEVVMVEGNAYFPPDTVNWEHLTENSTTSRCFWKGKANYFDATLDGSRHDSVGWTYHTPSKAAADIADHVAFWGAVKIENGT